MSLSREEKETIINWNAIEDKVTLFTSQPEIWRKIEKFRGFELVQEEQLMDGDIGGKEFIFPKSFIRFTKRGITIAPSRIVTIERQNLSRKALQKARKPSKFPSIEENPQGVETPR